MRQLANVRFRQSALPAPAQRAQEVAVAGRRLVRLLVPRSVRVVEGVEHERCGGYSCACGETSVPCAQSNDVGPPVARTVSVAQFVDSHHNLKNASKDLAHRLLDAASCGWVGLRVNLQGLERRGQKSGKLRGRVQSDLCEHDFGNGLEQLFSRSE